MAEALPGDGKRVIGLDLARALAVFGMVIVNFKIVMGAAENGPGWLVSLVGLLDGRAVATFVVLAGVGISLLSRSGRMSGDPELVRGNRNRLLRRAGFLFVVGALYTPIWPADILHFYGVYIGIAAFLLVTPTSRLWAYAGSLLLGFVVLLLVLDYERGWDWSTLSYSGLWSPSGAVRHMFFNGFHPVVPWLAFLLVGMILGRQDLSSPGTQRRVFAWGAGVAIVAEIASRLLIRTLSIGAEGSEVEDIAALLGTAPMPPVPLYMLAGAGTACAVIAVAVAVGQRHRDSAWLRPLVATGQLALTLYVAHVVVGMGVLEAVGRLQNQTLEFALPAALVFCAAGLAFAHFWRLHFTRGPVEALMRAVSARER